MRNFPEVGIGDGSTRKKLPKQLVVFRIPVLLHLCPFSKSRWAKILYIMIEQ